MWRFHLVAMHGDVITVHFDTPRPDTGLPEQPQSTRDQNRLLKIAVGVLAVVALVLGIVLVTDTTNGNDSAPPDDVAQVLDDYIAAWENQDVDGTANYVIVDEAGTLKISDHYWAGVRLPILDWQE